MPSLLSIYLAFGKSLTVSHNFYHIIKDFFHDHITTVLNNNVGFYKFLKSHGNSHAITAYYLYMLFQIIFINFLFFNI